MVASKTITIRPIGGRAKKVKVPSNAKVSAILKKAGIDVKGKKIKMVANGVMLTTASTMGRHTELLLIPTVKGGA